MSDPQKNEKYRYILYVEVFLGDQIFFVVPASKNYRFDLFQNDVNEDIIQEILLNVREVFSVLFW